MFCLGLQNEESVSHDSFMTLTLSLSGQEPNEVVGELFLAVLAKHRLQPGLGCSGSISQLRDGEIALTLIKPRD